MLYTPETHELTISELVKLLQNVYCGTLSAEFEHIQNLDERVWFAKRMEKFPIRTLTNDQKVHYAKLMLKSQAFDHFLANKFTTVKRYGGEGGESAMIFFDYLFQLSAQNDLDSMVISMNHRGRLNLLTCLLNFPPVTMFQKMKGRREFPDGVKASGDVLSHLTSSVDLEYDGRLIHVTMVPNPSHLEAGNPIATGKARARMQSLATGYYGNSDGPINNNNNNNGRRNRVLCLHVHGDAAMSGQGIVAETFLLANVANFSVGGTLHLIINNQIGFTTEADRGRSSHNCSDIGKMIDCPVLRVNADYPESVTRACEIATEYRERFEKDIIVDFICYRKWGHNELDEPSFTQPIMYKAIRSRSNVPDLYTDLLVREKVCTRDDLTSDVAKWNEYLSEQLKLIDTHIPKANHLTRQWGGMSKSTNQITVWDTGVDIDDLKYIGAKSVTLPPNFRPHPTLQKSHIDRRLQKLVGGSDIDWPTAEALAVGSLLNQGMHVRLSGQDVGRGTFSHRHAMFVDQLTDEAFVPLNQLRPDQKGFFEVANSPLSEEAVLGFEYGFSVEGPNVLTIWEAQFGDFFNGAQIIIDTFVTGGETKWLMQSSLTLLLPHGLDGAGPEHSSCKIERFLQATDSKEDGVDADDVNIQVANPTTPAQFFHLLRRQMVRDYRKPLIVIAPKGLLRHPQATSSLSEMSPGTFFKPILPDDTLDPKHVTKVVFVSGKHYYTLLNERDNRKRNDVALIRIESLCPFPILEIQVELKKYKRVKEYIWSQEEHRNQGAWSFANTRLSNVLGLKLRYSGRKEGATPAVGIGEIHKMEAQSIVDSVFK
ncbi:hypothetical protein HELRODRAFT_106795 [Helobdella robusta]|uniref:Transketolase-like pyrimidine-binding domain-containing protein n=1 Tax=Helobdella robusta TaxID=6412 RepID=T1EE50_HELRO|nr:hypothetical protein HELRODRAFT_106795 [Helobdella robusta]ESO02643.1 hypothetical protein HELRODRAFT_106795 [Helobdella robusta]